MLQIRIYIYSPGDVEIGPKIVRANTMPDELLLAKTYGLRTELPVLCFHKANRMVLYNEKIAEF